MLVVVDVGLVLVLGDELEEGGGDVGGGDPAEVGEAEAYTLLAGDTDDDTHATPELAVADVDMVVSLDMDDAVVADIHEVVVLGTGDVDEVLHLVGGNLQRGVLAVGIADEVVIVEAGNERQLGDGGEAVDVMGEQGLGLGPAEVGKEDVGDEVAELATAAAIDHAVLVAAGDVDIVAGLDEQVGGTVGTAVGGAERQPVLVRVGSVLYRHP